MCSITVFAATIHSVIWSWSISCCSSSFVTRGSMLPCNSFCWSLIRITSYNVCYTKLLRPFHSVYLERKCIPNPLPCLSNLNTWQLLPGFGPFVGSDITAGAIASGIHEQCGNTLLIDFGTNGEILLKAKNQYFVTATAAGPAFEGGILNCGKKAQKGVISSLELNSGTWSWTTIGYQHLSKSNEPTGISGA